MNILDPRGRHAAGGLGQGRTMATKPEVLEILELVKQLDQAIHLSMPPGGNANHERAQQACNELRRKLEEMK
jgi:hypothetical protein